MGVVSRQSKSNPTRKSVSSLAKQLSESLEDEIEQKDYSTDDYEDFEENTAVRADEESIEEEMSSREFDIFTDFGDIHAKKGDIPKYYIYKNGSLVLIKNHPYSWEQIQDELGGGHYKVRMSSMATGKIIKTQSQAIADSPISKSKDTEITQNNKFFDLLGTMNQTLQEQQLRQEERAQQERERFQREMKEQQEKIQMESQNQQNTMLAMLTALMSKPKDDSTEKMMMAMQQQSQQNMQMMIAMMDSSKGKDNSSEVMQMIMQMNQNTMLMMKEMSNNQAQVVDKITDKIEKLQHKDDGLGGLKLVELFQTAQSQGFEQMKMLNELAEMKASEKSDSDSDDDSITKTLIKSVVPMVGQLASIASAQKGVQAQQALPSIAPTQVPPTRNNRPQGQGQAQAKRPNTQGSVPINRQNGQPNIVGLPRPKVAKQPVAQNPKSGKIEVSGQKQKALEILIPFIGECLVGAKSEEVSARESIDKLIGNGIDPVIVIPQFSGKELIKIANDLGLRDEEYAGLNNWLEGYYDKILSFTASEIRQSSAN